MDKDISIKKNVLNNKYNDQAQQKKLKLRKEIKYIINQADYIYITRRLRKLLTLDINSSQKTGGYHVDSLYFDNFCNSCLYEKEAGIENRNKYRIRTYNSSPYVIMLEKKMKRGFGVTKQSLKIDLDEYTRILEGDLKWMKINGKSLLLDFYERIITGMFSPKVIVSYFREPYVYPAGNVRITFDKNLSCWGKCLDLFAKAIHRKRVFHPSLMVMEVKYTGFLPSFIRRLIDIENREAEACSKYYYCVNGN